MSAPPQLPEDFDAIVLGAGFAGLHALRELRAAGLSAHVLEAGDDVGGTWYWNRYPGARCDSESYYYAPTFSEELEQEWEWTERYPAQPEVLRFLQHVADRFDLRRDISFDTRAASAEFDDPSGTWSVRADDGRCWRARYLITAVGCLSATNVPDLPGLASFAGRWLHTGRWPHEEVDFTGLRVGVIGTGSTGIQAIPVIAEQAEHLHVFQRTPNFSVPARNAPADAEFHRWVKQNYREVRRAQHESSSGHPFDMPEFGALDVPAEQREQIYERAWQVGGLRFRAAFGDLLADQAANDTAADFIRGKIRQIVRDPGTAALLEPRDHPFAAKRPPIDTGYFETYNREDVTLVDVRQDSIRSITPRGVRTGEREYPLDVLVFATGFDAMTGPLLSVDIRGADGRRLADWWGEGPRSYLGLQVAGFPNMFTITGPGSPSVLTNVPTSIEQHVDWIVRCLQELREEGHQRIEATERAEQHWVDHVREAAHATLMPKADSSWYLGANVPGKPQVFMPYAGGFAQYAEICAQAAADGYAGFARS